MKFIEIELNNVPSYYEIDALCLGYFDGVHLGHQEMVKQAKKHGKVGVLTFNNSPAFILGKAPTKETLTCADDKADYFEELGVDYMFIMQFNNDLAKVTREEFYDKIIKQLNAKILFCGQDFKFGKDGLGDPEFLKSQCQTITIDLVKVNDKKVSSKDIRNYVREGQIETANTLLNHPYRIGGYVVSGEHKGRVLGFPTANLDLDYPYVMPKNGVYIGYAIFQGSKHKCLICIGTHPTLIELQIPIIEVHVINFSGLLYGDYLFIELEEKLRDIVKFDNTELLKIQLQKDRDLAIQKLK